ncbi:flavoprotein [Phyllobacterium phragmitis]|uniref:Flavoprotein n=1 Tax=Phyllobacterium phragmitis TaxID=2670329 RepID=A0ABQ0GY72_9HYPH
MTNLQTPRWAWVLTGSGHFFVESFELIRTLEHCDIFVSKAANEVLRMYKLKLDFPDTMRVLHDKTASAVPVGGFYHGIYHTVVIAPATSNTVAKCVVGISDTLATNVYAQAGKCRVPSIVFACDTAPELETMAPGGLVKVYPRPIDLENTARLKQFERTHVVESLVELREAIERRKKELAVHG